MTEQLSENSAGATETGMAAPIGIEGVILRNETTEETMQMSTDRFGLAEWLRTMQAAGGIKPKDGSRDKVWPATGTVNYRNGEYVLEGVVATEKGDPTGIIVGGPVNQAENAENHGGQIGAHWSLTDEGIENISIENRAGID